MFRIARRLKIAAGWHEDRFLSSARGIIHVGGNVGQEAATYAKHDLPVAWIEPIPDVFAQLQQNIKPFGEQRAIQALVTDRAGVDCDFHIASNNGASSSVLPLGRHRELWPGVGVDQTIALTSTTLDSLVNDNAIEPARYDALVMDTQGSELMVLRGAERLLPSIRFVKTEAPDFESYEGCCTRDELAAHLVARGFKQTFEEKFAGRRDVGNYYTLVFQR